METQTSQNDSTHPVHKTLASAGNLANLLPTNSVLIFQALVPSFSKNGVCTLPNKYLTSSIIIFCSLSCFLSSFTDTFKDNGTLYYGLTTFKGLHITGYKNDNDDNNLQQKESKEKEMEKLKITFLNFVHAFASSLVFLIFAFYDSNVQSCFFAGGRGFETSLRVNLPLVAGVLSSFFFSIFSFTRKGIGHQANQHVDPNCN